MVEITKTLQLSTLGTKPIFDVVQSDTGRVLRFRILDTNIPETAHAYIYISKPSGHESYDMGTIELAGGITIDENNMSIIAFKLTAETLSELGMNDGQVQVIYNDELVTSFEFGINVLENLANDSRVTESDEYKAFIESVSEIGRVEERTINKINSIKTEVENGLTEVENDLKVLENRMDTFTKLAEGSTTGDAELIDGRVSYDGVTYANIGGNIRESDTLINGHINKYMYNPNNISDSTDDRPTGWLSVTNVLIEQPITDITGRVSVSVILPFFDGLMSMDYTTKVFLFELNENDTYNVVHVENLPRYTSTNTSSHYELREFIVNYELSCDKTYFVGFDKTGYKAGTNNVDMNVVNLPATFTVGDTLSSSTKNRNGIPCLYWTAYGTKIKNYWENKTGNYLGDSLTAQNTFTKELVRRHNYIINNYGVSGTTITNINPTNTFRSRIDSMSENCDYIFVLGGTNDWGLGCLLGNYSNPTYDNMTNFSDALYTTLNDLRVKYKDKPIFLSYIPQRNWQGSGQAHGMNNNGQGYSIHDFNNAINVIGRRFGCILLDMYGSATLCAENLNIYTQDNLHFNVKGGNLIATFIHNKLADRTPN